jgi:hypothetical protein
MGPNCQPTGGNGGPIFVGPAKLGRPAGRILLPKRTSAVRVGFGVCGPTQTDYFRPLRTPKWVGPLEMPLPLGHIVKTMYHTVLNPGSN